MATVLQDVSIAIIGAGISGLTAAHCLLKTIPGRYIHIFDKEPNIGGRLVSMRIPGERGIMEMGAGRYHRKKHPRLHNLIRQFGIACIPFYYERGHPLGDTRESREMVKTAWTKLRAYHDRCSAEEHATQSFWAVAEKVLGPEMRYVLKHAGYDALTNRHLPFEHGIDILSTHPETEQFWGNRGNDWASPENGFQALSKKIHDSLISNGCTLHSQHRLASIRHSSGDANGRFVLSFETDRGHKHLEADYVVQATSLRDFLGLHHRLQISGTIADNLINVPLLKGYIKFPEPWWETAGYSGQCIVTRSALRKLYFKKGSSCMMFYSDSESAIRANELLGTEHGVSSLIHDLRKTLRVEINIDETLGQADWNWKFWSRGISFWSGGINRVSSPVWEPYSGLFVCSDLCTPYIGWIEGGILSAEEAAMQISRRLAWSGSAMKSKRTLSSK